MLIRIFTYFLTFTTICQAVPPNIIEKAEQSNCGYESCHPIKEGFINVHLVPHTHDDVGWLKTVDQYYYGSNSRIQMAGVQYILDSVLDELRKDPDRRFIYVETSYLWKWWKQQHDIVKHQFKKYILNGQLEIIGGGWSMNDEATTHYQSIIDQFTWGLRRLNDTFGKCGRPKVGWQIDPFGHSREMASIFSQLGFDGLLLGRIDYQDKSLRFSTKTPEMIWQGSDNLNASEIFTSVMFNTYSPPPGFCFDILCSDDPIIDDKKSPDYNVDKRIAQFLEYVKNMTKVYATNNVIVTMGEDFNYQDAHTWFKNIDKLILYTNKLQDTGSKYNLLYSTPSCYLKAVYEEARKDNISFPVKTDDFFPYASDPHAYWTGYFTSKPTIKRYERLGNNFLQVCKQLYALTDLGPEDWADLNAMREAMGVMQHHDAITGTEKEHVAHDYARLLSAGFDECRFTTATALSKIVTKKQKSTKLLNRDPAPAIPFSTCLLANISQCEYTENSNSFIVTVYNPLSRPVNHYVRLPVVEQHYKVSDPNGKDLPIQMVPIPDSIKKIPGRQSNAMYEIIFLASDLPPLGFKSYYVMKSSGSNLNTQSEGDVNIEIDQNTGLISKVTMNGKTIPLEQNFFYYRGTVGNNARPENRSSGAYIFRPNGTDIYKISWKSSYQIFKGDLVSEVHQTFNDWVSQIIRIYNGENFVEFDWVVGPIPTGESGKEVISLYTTNLKSESTFYTDSNGRELLKRVRNFRPTWKLSLTEPISSNYYPVTSKILIRDPNQDVEVAVLTDRAQGGSSLNDGEIELMIHRNCLHDDGFGVDEPLYEKAFNAGLVARGSHYLVVGPYLNNTGAKTLAAQERDLAQRKLLAAWTFLSPTNGLSFAEYKAKYAMEYSGLTKSLPDNVQILTLEPWYGMNFLLRLEHVLERNEDPNLSKPVTVNLKGLFTPFQIVSLRETTLGANEWLNENSRLKFKAGQKLETMVRSNETLRNDPLWYDGYRKWIRSQHESNDINLRRQNSNTIFKQQENFASNDEFSVTLDPMQIRTFIIDIQKNYEKYVLWE
ncbi:hypothetical protein ILUMI_08618 [Ignelater luminosus]|uniref:Alpha-mannosidase n=1 Tax=Ignelater luminosus TaxID=2038154 RepID=A0A8K0D6K1_IGNLU|nr:hypothetical protein ILUMI_08618 [Ignelater luminosus]